MNLLDRLLARGVIRDLDLHFARLMGRLAVEESDHLLLAAALASQAAGEGHVCLELARVADGPLWEGGEHAPPLTVWREALRGSGLVGGPDASEPCPLILEDDRLYLARYHFFETRLATALAARADWIEGIDEGRLRAGLARLFPAAPVLSPVVPPVVPPAPCGRGQLGLFDEPAAPTPDRQPDWQPDWQRLAAALAVLRRFAVISGGPGTGKTRTVTSILALLAEQGVTRIALAAPTGKAAARLSESIKQAKVSLPLGDGLRTAIPEEAVTLHRLLGVRPGRARPRHHADNPLHLELLVVDEASMVDLPLMARLLDALPATCRLILLGDRDQLASVEAGAVLGDICGEDGGEGGSGWSAAATARLVRVTDTPPAVGGRAPPIADSIAILRRSYRFGGDSGIGELARAVNAGDGGHARELLAVGRFDDLALHPADEREVAGLIARRAVEHYRPFLEAATPQEALAAFDRYRILCALREGPFGVVRANEGAERALCAAGLIPRRERGDLPWYPGRPILVGHNDYALGLFNGDIGLILPDPQADGALRAFFPPVGGADGALRRLHPNRLPEVETVYAMTVHKSQGSEFDRLLLILPPAENPLATRELLYTGITRARRAVELCAAPNVLEQVARRRVYRTSGLRARLWGRSLPV
ncbi:exodeoxyribonuclease V subunit alpha [Endothiovibrio diazotrophicus]